MEFNIEDLIRKAHFGDYVALPFPNFTQKALQKKRNAKSVGNETVLKDVLGRSFFMDFKVELEGVQYYLPNEPLVSISLQNTIVKTVVLGREKKGTVKEWISNDDYSLTIRGVCVEKNQEQFPYSQVELLRKLSEHRKSIEIQNDLLRLFGIYSIVIESAEYEDMLGMPNAQKYTIKALSDTDFFADLTEKRNLNKL